MLPHWSGHGSLLVPSCWPTGLFILANWSGHVTTKSEVHLGSSEFVLRDVLLLSTRGTFCCQMSHRGTILSEGDIHVWETGKSFGPLGKANDVYRGFEPFGTESDRGRRVVLRTLLWVCGLV